MLRQNSDRFSFVLDQICIAILQYQYRMQNVSKRPLKFEKDKGSEDRKSGDRSQSKSVRLVLRINNPASRMNRALYTTSNINYRNFLFINEQSMRGNDRVFEPFLESVFNFKKGASVELTQNYIRVNLEDRQIQTVPMKYLVERYRSFGDFRFVQMANAIEKLELIIERVCQIMEQHRDYCSEQALQKVLEQYAGKPYIAYYQAYKNKELTIKSIILSTELVELLGYVPEDLSIKFTRTHIVRNFEIINSRAYPDFVFNYAQLMYQFNYLILHNGFSPEIWASIAQCDRYLPSQLYSYNEEKINVQIKLNLHNPCFGVYQISKILGKLKQFSPKRLCRPTLESESALEQYQQIEAEQKSISQVIKVPKTELVWNQKSRCGYRQI